MNISNSRLSLSVTPGYRKTGDRKTGKSHLTPLVVIGEELTFLVFSALVEQSVDKQRLH